MATKTELVKKLLDRLRGALGTGENPDGSNHNFITDWYNANVEKIGNGPWCEMTNTWAMWTAGFKSLKSGRAYTVYAAQDGQHGANESSWHWGTTGLMAGDQVYYDWDAQKGDTSKVDHTGTVEKINGDGTFYVLEGNTNNHLERKLRDGKYVVGYVRFAWSRLGDAPAPTPTEVKPPAKPVSLVKQIQTACEVAADGLWGPKTDARTLLMRTAARTHCGYPHNVNNHFDIRTVQGVIDTKVDGVWGPKSQAALVYWVKVFQRILGVAGDGLWGPHTDEEFLKERKKYLMH